MSGINSDDNFIASVSRRAAGRVTVLLLITPVVRLLSVLNGLRAGSLTRGATTAGVSTRFATTGGEEEVAAHRR